MTGLQLGYCSGLSRLPQKPQVNRLPPVELHRLTVVLTAYERTRLLGAKSVTIGISQERCIQDTVSSAGIPFDKYVVYVAGSSSAFFFPPSPSYLRYQAARTSVCYGLYKKTQIPTTTTIMNNSPVVHVPGERPTLSASPAVPSGSPPSPSQGQPTPPSAQGIGEMVGIFVAMVVYVILGSASARSPRIISAGALCPFIYREQPPTVAMTQAGEARGFMDAAGNSQHLGETSN